MEYEITPEALAQPVSLSKKLVTFKSCGMLRVDDLAKSQKMYFFVIPAKAGIQYFQ